jgi:hypothetical protein
MKKVFYFYFYSFIYFLFPTGSAAWKYGGGRFNENGFLFLFITLFLTGSAAWNYDRFTETFFGLVFLPNQIW